MKTIRIALAALLFVIAPRFAFADDAQHKIAFHVDQNDPAVMNMALNNIKNINSYYAEKGESVTIELVAYGPGLMMLRKDKSPVQDRISTMALEMPNLAFSACGNTQKAMSKAEGIDVPLVSEAVVTPSGVVRLTELQEQGYAYIRP